MKKDIPNKAVQMPHSMKDASVIIFNENDVTIISDLEIKQQIKDDELRDYQKDGMAWIRYPEKRYDHLRKNLTRQQRLALKRRGIQVD